VKCATNSFGDVEFKALLEEVLSLNVLEVCVAFQERNVVTIYVLGADGIRNVKCVFRLNRAGAITETCRTPLSSVL